MSANFANYQRIEQAIGFLTDHFLEQPSLEEVAARVQLSPFHFQRLFVDWVGLSPKKFLKYLTSNYLKDKIRETQSVLEAADLAGFSSQSRVYDLFVTVEGMTPQEYKSQGLGLQITYGYHPSPFGMCFIAVTARGICGLRFIDESRQRDEFARFLQQWPAAELLHDPQVTQPYVQRIFQPAAGYPERLQVLVQGTAFQVKVWEALVDIPFGSVRSYQQVADDIGQPTATRAVGMAAARNPLLYLIPCHRIICQDGTVGNFHWGQARKKAMIGYEMSTRVRAQESGCR
ncbi:bifunctional transcriptional activator/DNA repair enzyme AdaA [Hymenobacter terrenus]|uniref:bifunctional transcriptional activator/DNA repair enzyme AdaA n=1 Tax=Hymenobacter terrenus TaxID=1629124 RepID=UPI000619BA70|nr:methylated-DNA--[protein]-cysteine S-methyltransferase [Hymenobacter terrenus]